MVDFEKSYGECQQRSASFNAESQSVIDDSRFRGQEALELLASLYREINALRSEPLVHSHTTDGLPEYHPLAYQCVYCNHCQVMVHCSNNECMSTWAEWDQHVLCGPCFSEVLKDGAMHLADFKQKATATQITSPASQRKSHDE
jgi:hypothetical protein